MEDNRPYRFCWLDRPKRSNSNSLNKVEACQYLGISLSCLKKLLKGGYIHSFKLPSKLVKRQSVRILKTEIEWFIKQNSFHPTRKKIYDPDTAPVLPEITVAKLLGYKTVKKMHESENICPPYNYERIRHCMEVKARRKIRAEFNRKFKARIKRAEQRYRIKIKARYEGRIEDLKQYIYGARRIVAGFRRW